MKKSNKKSYRDLIVWRKAHRFFLTVCRTTDNFPMAEYYELTAQMRRASVAIVDHLSKDYKEHRRNLFSKNVMVCEGALQELQNYINKARALGYLKDNVLNEKLCDLRFCIRIHKYAVSTATQ